MRTPLLILALAGCDMLGPRVSDQPIDAPKSQIDAKDAPPGGPKYVLPAGSTVPPVSDNAELLSQIKIFDGLNDTALAMAGGVVTRSTGKAGGVTVLYWNFGATVPIVDGFVLGASLYMLADDDGAGNLTPRTDHPWLLDAIPGDSRYSAAHRIIYVPVTSQYAGQVIPSIEALDEAITLGLVGEPKLAGTWRNVPVVPPGTRLELGGTAAPMDATHVYARGYVVDVLPLAIPQPLSGGRPQVGQESRLLSGIATGTPPILPTTLDAQPVFQYGIPPGPPTTTFNYTPIVTELDVRLASGIAPAAINNDTQLFQRSVTGAITGFNTDNVASFTVTTTVSDKQIQFMDGAP